MNEKFCRIVVAFLFCIYGVDSGDLSQIPSRHILVTPSRLLAASSNRICLSRHGSSVLGTATVQIDLLSLGWFNPNVLRNSTTNRQRYIARARKIFTQGNGGCLDLLVPKTPFRKVLLQFRMRLDSQPQLRIVEKRELHIQHDTNMLVIQTDKPIYRAGETVKFRVLQLKPDLTPLQLPIYRVSIETPPDMFGGPVKVVQWFNVSTQLGLIQREYQIDKYALQGEWRIVVDSREPWVGSTVQPFTVTDYTLSKFHVTVDYDKEILKTLQYYSYIICAKYTYGEYVPSKLLVTLKSDSPNSKDLYHEGRLDIGRGCYNYSVETKRIGFGTQESPKIVIATFAVQEDGSRVWQNTTVTSNVVNNVVKIHFVTRQYTHYKAGLPYKIKAKVSDWRHKPVVGAKVQFCKLLSDETEEVDNQATAQVLYNAPANSSAQRIVIDNLIDECNTSLTDDKGIATYLFIMGDEENIQHVRLKAIVIDHPLHNLECVDGHFPSAILVMESFGNSSTDNIEIGHPLQSNSELHVGSRQSFPVYLTTWEVRKIAPMTLHYLFITGSGNIFRWGTTMQCPIPITLADAENPNSMFATYDTTIYSNGTEECPGRTQYTSPSGLYKMSVSVKMSHIMCPSSTLIIYYMTSQGEMVIASHQFRVHECFYNKVHMRWSPSQVVPSSVTTLQLRTPVPSSSLCLLSAASTAFKHLSVVEEQPQQIHYRVIYALNSLMERRKNRTMYNMKTNLCFEDDPQFAKNDLNDYYNKVLTVFLSSGVEVLTDMVPQRQECPKIEELVEKPSDLYIPDFGHSKDRSYFPETWLWDVHVLDSKGHLDVAVKVPDEITQWECQVYCLSRFGLAVMSSPDSGILKVMQPFFVDLTTPRVIKRGEDVQMFYKIFNYMDYSLPVSVSLEVTPSAAASITSHTTGDRPLCLKKGESITSFFKVRGHQLRAINVTVVVHVTNNALSNCGTNYAGQNIRDGVTKIIMIEPEGHPMENYKSALMCVDEINNKTEQSWIMDKVKCSQQSENWFISLVGDITGPMYMNIENLLTVPVGCGEQNMAMLAYNLIALEYALAGKRVASDIKEKSIRNIATGYQRQMRFRHPLGGFSAFGAADESPSTWLTAFTIAYLPNIASRIENISARHMDTNAIDDSIKWLLENQMENGCFRNEGVVFHREMKGGLNDDTSAIALTSFVILSLIDSKSPLVKPSVIQNSQYCLAALKYHHVSQKRHSIKMNVNREKIYALSLATFAQIKIDEYFKNLDSKNDVLAEKRNLVKREVDFEYYGKGLDSSENDDYMEYGIDDSFVKNYVSGGHVVDNLEREADIDLSGPLLIGEKRKEGVLKEFLSNGGLHALNLLKSFAQRAGDMMWWEAESLPVSIETTSYVMMSMLTVGDEANILDSMAAAKWLSMHRTRKGGFISTQDTLVGIRAICLLRHLMPGVPPSLRVNIRAPERARELDIGPGERHKLHTVMVRSVDVLADRGDAKLTVGIQGRGCVLVQVTQRYNAHSRAVDISPFRILAKVTTDGTFSCSQNSTSCMCAAMLEICVSWISPSSFPEMAILEVQLPTGYYADRSLLYGLLNNGKKLLHRIEESFGGNTIFLYLMAEEGSTRVGSLSECLPIYLVGLQSYTVPAVLSVYDYYHTDVSYSVNYTIPESCDVTRAIRPHQEPMDLVEDVQLDSAVSSAMEAQDDNMDTLSISDWTNESSDKQDSIASLVNEWNGQDLDQIDSQTYYLLKDDSNITSDNDALPTSTHSVSPDGKTANSVTVTESMNDMFTKDWHVIDSVEDLETPQTVEGVPPVFVLPPPSFTSEHHKT